MDRTADHGVDVEDRVVIGVVELLWRAAVRDVGVVAGRLEAQEFRWMPVAIERTMAAAAEVQHDELFTVCVMLQPILEQRQDVLVVAMTGVTAVSGAISFVGAQLSYRL